MLPYPIIPTGFPYRRKAPVVAFMQPLFHAVSHGPVPGGDLPACSQGHAQRHFRHLRPERGGSGKHPDAPVETSLIVQADGKRAADVDHCAKMRSITGSQHIAVAP